MIKKLFATACLLLLGVLPVMAWEIEISGQATIEHLGDNVYHIQVDTVYIVAQSAVNMIDQNGNRMYERFVMQGATAWYGEGLGVVILLTDDVGTTLALKWLYGFAQFPDLGADYNEVIPISSYPVPDISDPIIIDGMPGCEGGWCDHSVFERGCCTIVCGNNIHTECCYWEILPGWIVPCQAKCGCKTCDEGESVGCGQCGRRDTCWIHGS